MQRGTIQQRSRVANSPNPTAVWVEFGFEADEATAMVTGATEADAIERQGGVWRVGEVEFPQAISREHAIKLYIWNFGNADFDDLPINLVRRQGGATWVVA